MKILHVTSSLDPRGGGVAEAIRQFGAALARAGYHTEVATLDPPGAEWLEGLPFPVHALGPSKTSYQYAPGLLPWLRRRRGDFDCVLSHGMWQYHGFATWRAWRSKRARGPRFVFAHGMLDPWFKRAHPRKHLKKWLYWPWAEYRILREARAVFFTCEEERRLARESFWLYRANEAVANLGIDSPPGDPAQQRELFFETYPFLRGQRLLLFLGRMHPKKGCDFLVKAFRESARGQEDWSLVMAGPGQDEYLLELGAERAQSGRWEIARGGPLVFWPGMLSGDLKWGALHAAEALILPSHQENFGIAVAEALACGIPVLISDKVNIWREIMQDKAGLVAPDDFAGVRDLLDRWFALSPDERHATSERARRCFEARFRIERAAEALVEKLREFGVEDG